MAVFINGRPINPIVSFLVTAAVAAGLIGLGILLLPFIGGVLLFILLLGLGVVCYGAYYRWRYGDPLKRMQEAAVKEMQRRAQGQTRADGPTVDESDATLKKGQVRTGVRRISTVEDVTVVEEIRRRDA